VAETSQKEKIIYFQNFTPSMRLQDALRTIHSDRLWWQKVLIGGALMCTLAGYPLAAGLVVESLDNTRKGYPTPLPPWVDLSTRFIIGLFAFLIDFLFFILPFFLGGLLFFCAGFVTVLSKAEGLFGAISSFSTLVLVCVLASMFLLGVAPVGRLIFVEDSSPEGAMSMKSLREALRPGARGVYLRARLASLPAYLPALLLGALLVVVVPSGIPFSWLIALLLLWLTASAILYAHLVTIQIYAGAEHELRGRGLERPID
jgi:hypothetical protein